MLAETRVQGKRDRPFLDQHAEVNVPPVGADGWVGTDSHDEHVQMLMILMGAVESEVQTESRWKVGTSLKLAFACLIGIFLTRHD
jgi:hypothetical protein